MSSHAGPLDGEDAWTADSVRRSFVHTRGRAWLPLVLVGGPIRRRLRSDGRARPEGNEGEVVSW